MEVQITDTPVQMLFRRVHNAGTNQLLNGTVIIALSENLSAVPKYTPTSEDVRMMMNYIDGLKKEAEGLTSILKQLTEQ